MKGKFIIKRKDYYFVLFLIILIAIFAFYLSCKSKSPTEATSALNDQISVQSTNNTTTSSSTTTTVKPGQSPTNTTTLITSRTLTTTSTSTTSTSTSTTTTTSIRPTTTTSVHSTCATAKMELVEVKVNGTPVADGSMFTAHPGDELKIVTKFCNNGTGTSQFCQFGLGSAGCIDLLKINLPWHVLVPPSSCTTGFIKVAVTADCSQNNDLILIEWGYCDSEGNHCNKGPIFYTINLNIVLGG